MGRDLLRQRYDNDPAGAGARLPAGRCRENRSRQLVSRYEWALLAAVLASATMAVIAPNAEPEEPLERVYCEGGRLMVTHGDPYPDTEIIGDARSNYGYNDKDEHVWWISDDGLEFVSWPHDPGHGIGSSEIHREDVDADTLDDCPPGVGNNPKSEPTTTTRPTTTTTPSTTTSSDALNIDYDNVSATTRAAR